MSYTDTLAARTVGGVPDCDRATPEQAAALRERLAGYLESHELEALDANRRPPEATPMSLAARSPRDALHYLAESPVFSLGPGGWTTALDQRGLTAARSDLPLSWDVSPEEHALGRV